MFNFKITQAPNKAIINFYKLNFLIKLVQTLGYQDRSRLLNILAGKKKKRKKGKLQI
jgi:hypothetical protein